MEQQFAVVGAGLVGSALTRRIAEAGGEVVCFGPRAGQRPFSSHDDSGRITRTLDASPIWASLAARAISAYSDIEARSGVRFHHPVGVLWSAATEAPLEALRRFAVDFDVDIDDGLGGWDGDFGPSGDPALFEHPPAGYISPKDMVRAHRSLALTSGAAFDVRTVTGIERIAGRWRLRLDDGEAVTVDRVAVTAGAGTTSLVELELSVTGEVVIDAAVPDDVGLRLSEHPVIGRLDIDGSSVEGYLTPPIRGGDGWAIKFGAESSESPDLPTPESVSEWMTGTEHRLRLPAMEQALSDLLPSIVFGRIRSRPCLYTITPSGLPVIDEIQPGLVVATGGNGRMAKSADAVAELAAALVVEGEWAGGELDRTLFGA